MRLPGGGTTAGDGKQVAPAWRVNRRPTVGGENTPRARQQFRRVRPNRLATIGVRVTTAGIADSRPTRGRGARAFPAAVARSGVPRFARQGSLDPSYTSPDPRSPRPVPPPLPPDQTCRYDVPDLRRRSTREQRLHHQHPGVGRPAGAFRATILIYSSAPAPTHYFIFTVRAPPSRRIPELTSPSSASSQDKSRKRSCDDDEQEMSCKRQQGAQDANHVLQSMTNCAHFGK